MRREIAFSGGGGNICHLNNLKIDAFKNCPHHSFIELGSIVPLCLVSFFFMATENVPIRLTEGDTTWVSEVTLYCMQPWKASTRWIIHLQDPVLSIAAIFSMLFLKNCGGLERTLSLPLSLFYFFPHTFFQVALWNHEHKYNVWPKVTCGGCMAHLLLEKEYCRWDDRSMDRLFPGLILSQL